MSTQPKGVTSVVIINTKHYRVNPAAMWNLGLSLSLSGSASEAKKLGKGQPHPNILVRYSRNNTPLKTFEPGLHGGRTEVTVVDENDIEYVGIATCSMQDPFCYKTGRDLALENALKLTLQSE